MGGVCRRERIAEQAGQERWMERMEVGDEGRDEGEIEGWRWEMEAGMRG